MLNATSVKTEEDLVKLLMELGFDSDILLPRHPIFENIPARLIYANKPFEEGGPVIVAIDDNSFEIWFFDWHVVFFYVWTSFEGGVSREELREAIITAGSEESMKARYPGPSPEE